MSKKIDLNKQIQDIYKISIVVYAILALAVVTMVSKVTYQLTWGFLAKDELASKTSAVLVPGSHPAFDLQIRSAILLILALSIIVPYLYIMRLQKQHQQAMKNRVLTLRWIDLGITTAIMVVIIAVLSGVTDIFTLILIAGLMATTCFLGWMAERQAKEAKKLVMPTFIASLFTGSFPWMLIFGYAVATPFLAAVRAPWYIYALYVSSLGSFTLLALNQFLQNTGYKQWKDYSFIERNYALISLFSKTAFAVILIIGLKK